MQLEATTNELKQKSMASAIPGSHNQKPSKVREEGELTSSDDDAFVTGSAATPPSSSAPKAPSPIRTSVQGANSGKLSSGAATGGSVHIQSQMPYSKGFIKNQSLLKTSNPGWRPPGVKDNLVISFSDDDDSGSDVEERSREKASVCDRPPLVLSNKRRPPAMPHAKPNTVSRTGKNGGKVMPQKVSSSRTFISSMAKIHESSVRSGASTLAEQKSWLKNPVLAGKSLASQDPGCSKNLEMSSSKLEDLRQQIALRENELKLKLVQQNKEYISEACREANTLGQSKDSSRKCKSIAANVQTNAKEPDKKRLKTDVPGVDVSCSLKDWISVPKQTASLINATSTDTLERSMSKHPGVVSKNQPSRSAPSQEIHESNIRKVNEHDVATSAPKKVKSASDSSLQARYLQVSNSKFGSPDVSLDNASLLLRLERSQGFDSRNVDLQSLFDLEELHDKELEEAQDLRRKCEVEESNALNAYRRAQRALLEANTRCTYLYRKRERYSAQLRSFLIEDPSLLYSTRHHNETEGKWNLANNIAKVNLDLIPSSHQLDEFEAGNKLGYASNVQSADGGDAHNRSSANEDGGNLGSEECSEPDASTSELGCGNNFASDGFRSPSCDTNLSADDDYETCSPGHRSLQANVTCPRSMEGEDNNKESEKDTVADSVTNFLGDGSQDPLFLEEYLRSKLISRLGASSLKRSGIDDNSETSMERAAEERVAGGKTQIIVQSVPLCDPKVCADECRDGPKKPESSMSKPLLNTQNQQVEEHCLSDSPVPTSNSEECGSLSADIAPTATFSSSSIFRSAMAAARPMILVSMQIEEHGCDTRVEANFHRLEQHKLCLEMTSSAEELVTCVGFGKIDSYTCKSAINPLWPLCMYELRGRCNNDECPWQHTKDYTDSNDCQSGRSSNCQNAIGQEDSSCVLTPPRYLVYLDTLKDESHGSHRARCFGSSGKNIFSHSLVVSSLLIKHLPSHEPCLHGNDGCVESYGGNGRSLYFQSRNGTWNPLRNGLADNDQSLELALIMLSQEVNKIEGMKKALSVLSRALDVDPSSLPIRIIYLLLYHCTNYSTGELSKKSSVQEDDLFSHAVKYSEDSYELWLLYINSRGRLDERFSAYERALARLCHYASANDGQTLHRSAAILDLFLQMLYCFCVSGNLAKAVQRIHRLVHADGDSDESHSLLLSDILQCLTISDKCIFWVCCVYLVVYRELPGSLVQRFEFEKDISSIEWPSVCLTVEEKQLVYKLVEMAVDSVGLDVDSKSLGSSTLKSAHLLAVNHIKVMAAIDGVESCNVILEKYRNLFSSCLDLILLSARAHDFSSERTNFENFEEIVSNWPQNVSGSQCIWNQLAENALEKGRHNKAKEIMDKWFHSAGVPLLFHNRSVDSENGDSNSISIIADAQFEPNPSTQISNCSNMDLVFGLLNLCLYKLFQNDVFEAHSAVDKALKVADTEVLRHCVKEHAAFFFNYGSQLMKDVSLHGLIDILKGYSIYARAIPVLEPITRNFIQDIQKPRTRQLVRNVLSPISPDSFLVNSVLEIWFGSSLLPPRFDKLKDMVDFVEAILEVSPANYKLVISVCKLVCKDSDSTNSKLPSVLFWASSLLVNTIYQAIPFPPEHAWVEAADLLGKLTSVQEISESFHQRALSAYPFSINLWKSFLNVSTGTSKRSSVIKAARDKGLELG